MWVKNGIRKEEDADQYSLGEGCANVHICDAWMNMDTHRFAVEKENLFDKCILDFARVDKGKRDKEPRFSAKPI